MDRKTFQVTGVVMFYMSAALTVRCLFAPYMPTLIMPVRWSLCTPESLIVVSDKLTLEQE
jgi:hypothetical protein